MFWHQVSTIAPTSLRCCQQLFNDDSGTRGSIFNILPSWQVLSTHSTSLQINRAGTPKVAAARSDPEKHIGEFGSCVKEKICFFSIKRYVYGKINKFQNYFLSSRLNVKQQEETTCGLTEVSFETIPLLSLPVYYGGLQAQTRITCSATSLLV